MKRAITRVVLAISLGLLPFAGSVAMAADWTVNDAVEVEENGKWYPSVILKTDAGRYFIHYNGFGAKYDLWVGPERVRNMPGAPPSPAAGTTASVSTGEWKVDDKVEAKDLKNGKWYKATVLKVAADRYFVSYDGYNEQAWVPVDAVHARPAGDLHPAVRQAFSDIDTYVGIAAKAISGHRPADEINQAVVDAESFYRSNIHNAQGHPQLKELITRYWAIGGARFDSYLNKAVQTAKTTHNINWFGPGGPVDTNIDHARQVSDDYLAYVGAPNAETARMATALAEARKTADQALARINGEWAASQTLPADSYAGADKASLKARIIATWQGKFPGAKVLSVRFPRNWERDASWATNAGYTAIQWNDISSLYAGVIVKTSDTLATIYPVGIIRNNRNHGQIEIVATKEGFNNRVPMQILLTKVK